MSSFKDFRIVDNFYQMVINHNPCETPFNGTVLAPFECRIDSAAQPE